MSKILLYCTKVKPYLYDLRKLMGEFSQYNAKQINFDDFLINGKIVGECDFEVEEITNCGTSFMVMKYDDLQESYRYTNKIARGSCLDYTDLKRYLGNKDGYAIHIKNLHIFDEPKELGDYFTKRPYNDINKIFTDEYMKVGEWYRPINNAPQNMMYAQEIVPFKEEHLIKGVLQEFRGNRVNEYILISIQPQWMCKILNGEKTIEVRKKVLKEMLENV